MTNVHIDFTATGADVVQEKFQLMNDDPDFKKANFGTQWTVTGDCCLSALNYGDGSTIIGATGKSVIMTVDGVEKPLRSGKYRGDLRLFLK